MINEAIWKLSDLRYYSGLLQMPMGCCSRRPALEAIATNTRLAIEFLARLTTFAARGSGTFDQVACAWQRTCNAPDH